MAFPDRLKLPLAFDPARLRADLAALAGTSWTEHFVRQNYEGDWSAMPLRMAADARHPVMMIYSDPNKSDYQDTLMLAASPYFREVLGSFDCEVHAARLMRLTPGSTIKEHSDGDLDAEHGRARIHIPITTGPDVVFELNRRRVDMAPGEAWYLRLSDPHRVFNRGGTDRVHLVVDVLMNGWLEGLMRDAAEATPA
ncbi:MAG: aspartyl/asparaginyl beta-hydroxylase domain-containing protein [Proteobacteria bacterium]|nr:aspartyl/asparaginyl beta-hydroxylase domain-containing protein [Pseudomonadota bacterium]